MAINISHSTTTANNSTIRMSNSTLNCKNCKIIGDNNIINGNNNDIFGDNCTINGNNNDVLGDNCTINGNNNDVEGVNCVLFGNNNDYKPKVKAEKTKSEPRTTGKFAVNGNSGHTYYGDTPMEAIDLMKFGEKEKFRLKQQELEHKKALLSEQIRNNNKLQQRRWKIDNVNLTDDEYNLVEEYMNEIKPLWETW